MITQARDLTESLNEGLLNVSTEQWTDLQEKLQSLEQTIQNGISEDAAVGQAGEQLNKIQEMLQGLQEMLSSITPSEESSESSDSKPEN